MQVSENYYLLTNKAMDKAWVIHKDGLLNQKSLAHFFISMEKEVSSIEEAYEYLRSIKEFTYSALTFGTKCLLCGQKSINDIYRRAFVHSIDYFDIEQMCSCGGELWMDKLPNGRYGLQCEKCGWIKPNVSYSGSENINII